MNPSVGETGMCGSVRVEKSFLFAGDNLSVSDSFLLVRLFLSLDCELLHRSSS